MERRNVLTTLASLLAAPATIAQQGFPQPGRAIRVIAPFAAGSGSDVMIRALVDDLAKGFNTSVVVDNKPGANGALAAELVLNAVPDGHTLLLGTMSTFSANPWLFKKLRYDPFKDFTPIARVVYFPCYLSVSTSSPATNLQQFLELARSRRLNLGFSNATGQVAGHHLMRVGKFEALAVPYKSTPHALTDLIGGQIDFMFADMASAQGLVKSGRIRPLAMMSDTRSALMPELPALGETLPGFEYLSWGGLLGPAGLSAPVVDAISREVLAVIQRPAIRERLTGLGIEPLPGDPKEFRRYMGQQHAVWGARITEAGIAAE